MNPIAPPADTHSISALEAGIAKAGRDAQLWFLDGDQERHEAAHCVLDSFQALLERRLASPSTGVASEASITFRSIRADDAAAYAKFVSRMTPTDLRMRFFDTRREIPEAERTRMTTIDDKREVALAAVRPDAAHGEAILGIVRAVFGHDPREAELAITVRSDLSHRGIGRMLLRRMVDALTARGLDRIVCDVMHDNTRMLDLALSEGFVERRKLADARVLRLELCLPGATPPSATWSRAPA